MPGRSLRPKKPHFDRNPGKCRQDGRNSFAIYQPKGQGRTIRPLLSTDQKARAGPRRSSVFEIRGDHLRGRLCRIAGDITSVAVSSRRKTAVSRTTKTAESPGHTAAAGRTPAIKSYGIRQGGIVACSESWGLFFSARPGWIASPIPDIRKQVAFWAEYDQFGADRRPDHKNRS
ncbi:hypothetical protein ES705_13539 [subsurface metagenome]